MLTSLQKQLENIATKAMRYKPREYFSRLLASFFTVLLLSYLSAPGPITQSSYYDNAMLPMFIYGVCVMFVFLCFVSSTLAVDTLLVSTMITYFSLTALETGSSLFSFALCTVTCAVVFFFVSAEEKFSIGRKTLLWTGLILIILYTLFVGGICCLYYKNYKTPCYDFGLFAQMFHYMKETGNCLITCERDKLLSHFAVHFSPVYYLLLPFYYLIPSPCTLLVLQALIVASGIVPLIFICKYYKLSDIASAVFALCYFLYPSFMGGCFWYLHENCFLAPFILWFIYFTEKESVIPAVIFALLTLCVKEDAPVYIAVIAVYFIFNNKNYKCNLCLSAVCVVYFLVVTKLMGVYGEGIMSDSRYGDYIYDGGGLFTLIKSVILNPAFALLQVFKEEKLTFIIEALAPVCFLPLAIKKPSKLILLIPFILVNLMTNYVYQYDVGYQYNFGSGCILFYLAVSGYAGLGKKKDKLLLCSLLCSIIFFSGGYMSKLSYISEYKNTLHERETLDYAVSLIPEDASVAANTFILANLSQRDEIYELETTAQITEYIVVDLRYEDNSTSPYINSSYIPIFMQENIIAIFKRVDNLAQQ